MTLGAGPRTPPPLSPAAWLRYDAIVRLLPPGGSALRILEIGAGLGSLGVLLARRFDYTGLEPDATSFATAVKRLGGSGRILERTVEELELGEPFDVVCAFEVLEHCEDDHAALVEWLRHLRPGGRVLLSVPLGRDRFGPWDRKAGHFRRYDRSDLVATMEGAGLCNVRTISYGFPLATATARIRDLVAALEHTDGTPEERTAASGRQLQPPEWTALAMRLASMPFQVLQRPFARTRLGYGLVARGELAGARDGLQSAGDLTTR